MSHAPNKLDIKTDLIRSIMASYSENGFNDLNAKTFLKKAEGNLKKVKISKSIYLQILKSLKKAKDTNNIIDKRREDILTASQLIS